MSDKLYSSVGGRWSCVAPGTAVCDSGSVPLMTLMEDQVISCLSAPPADCLISQVSVDSRKVGPGSLFVALPGTLSDGHDFIDQAVAAGCSALLVEKGRLAQGAHAQNGVSVLETDDTREAYGAIAESLFAHPAREMTMLAVTGTNGKTTVSYLLEAILCRHGKRPGVLGTVNYRYRTEGGETAVIPSPFTTPEPLLLQQTLREMADHGVDHVIMELSSHGLEQKRIGRLFFDVAAFTNLTRDHLDYHVTMDDYFAAKAMLFREHLAEDGRAVITFSGPDSHWSRQLQQLCREEGATVLTCGMAEGCAVTPLELYKTLRGTEIRLQTPVRECQFSSPLVGDFNVDNLQTAVAMGLALGIPLATISSALEGANGAPGRMQRIPVPAAEQDFRPTVFVDYAHTPDALEQVLKTLRELPHTKLTCVFGCGGDRDAGKRALMGEVAGRGCDLALITNDNPRSEDPRIISAAIIDGIKKTECCTERRTLSAADGAADKGFLLIPDRHQAIGAAIAAAGGGDIVLIAGKGHENYQLTREGRRFFDDSLEAAEALSCWNVHSLALATGGQILQEGEQSKSYGRIYTDSRSIAAGDVFLALKGERFDGHHYVEQVVASGAACLVLEQQAEAPPSVAVLMVTDSERALGDLAGYRRAAMKELTRPVVAAITGSSGKTTVKEMCAAIFHERWPDREDKALARVLKTEGNFNNLIGLPLSLLPVTPRHRALILEMGMNRPGEIERLAEIADPDIACIINVHGAHLQGLGDIEGVARAKGELFQTCTKDTVLVINNDDVRVVGLAEKCAQKKVFFGLGGDNSRSLDVHASAPCSDGRESTAFTLHIGEDRARVVLQVPGVHNVSNALAAAAIAHAACIDISLIARGLAAYVPTDRRMQILGGPGGSRVINDTYNANPASMKAGIDTLSQLGSSMSVAILGDMLELGPDSEALHTELGAHVAVAGIDFLAVLGDFAPFTAAGAMEKGMDAEHVRLFADQDSCLAWLKRLVAGGTVAEGSYILVKGSRGMRLEQLVEQIAKNT